MNHRDNPETRFEVALAEYNLHKARLHDGKGATVEERAYAKLLDARNQLRFKIQFESPETPDYKLLLHEGTVIPYGLEETVQAYTDALDAHGNEVMSWVTHDDNKNKSSSRLLEQANYEMRQPKRDAFIYEGRVEVLEGRVGLIAEEMHNGFQTLFATFKNTVEPQYKTLDQEINPEKYQKGVWNSLCFRLNNIWNSLFGRTPPPHTLKQACIALLLVCQKYINLIRPLMFKNLSESTTIR
ncbi:hypothetical protein [Simkania sp.]|uniref:hypothetical protein n=1 Tax=Simkania sp. TaxID=34094 RepID=UPI003B52A989